MKLPFTIEQFLNVFKAYNEAVYPLQFFLFISAVLVLIAIFNKRTENYRVIFFYLSFLWMWTGFVYHFIFFTTINKAAYLFSALFIIQAFIYLYAGFRIQPVNRYKLKHNSKSYIALFLLLYSLILYPALSYFFGHKFPYSPTFGLPCPSVIFTFAILGLIFDYIPLRFVFIPLIWSGIGFFAAINLNIYEDFGLFAAGILTLIFFLKYKKSYSALK